MPQVRVVLRLREDPQRGFDDPVRALAPPVALGLLRIRSHMLHSSLLVNRFVRPFTNSLPRSGRLGLEYYCDLKDQEKRFADPSIFVPLVQPIYLQTPTKTFCNACELVRDFAVQNCQ